jgi:hypothetical protein
MIIPKIGDVIKSLDGSIGILVSKATHDHGDYWIEGTFQYQGKSHNVKSLSWKTLQREGWKLIKKRIERNLPEWF